MARRKLLFRNLLHAAMNWAQQLWENADIFWNTCDSKWEG